MPESILDQPCVRQAGELVPFPKETRDEYWSLVELAVKEVFGEDPSIAVAHRADIAGDRAAGL